MVKKLVLGLLSEGSNRHKKNDAGET